METRLAYRPKNVLVLDTGHDPFNDLYQELLRYPEPLRVSIGSVTTGKIARIRVDNIAAKFNVETQHIDNIITTKDDRHTPDCIIVMAPRGKDRKETLIKLMTELSPSCPPILVGKPLIDSLAEAIELLAYAKKHNTTLCVETPRRYTFGVRAIRERLPDLAPISHIVASINSGAHLSMHNYMYGTVAQYADIICYLARETSETNEIPESLFCHHSDLYRDSISTSFAFQIGLIGTLASTSNHNQNTDADEILRVTGYERWISASDALQKHQYFAKEVKDFNTASYINTASYNDKTPPELLMKDFIDCSTGGGTDYRGREITYDNTLRSYLPALWMVQAMQLSIQTNQPVKAREVNNQPIFTTVSHIHTQNETNAERLKKAGIAYAQAGYFDYAIDSFTEWIDTKDTDT